MTTAAVTLDADQIAAIEAGGIALLRAGNDEQGLKLLALHLLARALAGEDYAVKVLDGGPLRVIEGGR